MFFERLLPLEMRRKRLLKRTSDPELQAYLSVPFHDMGSDYREAEYVALDLETTGLNANSDAMISIGLVEMQGMDIDLSTAWHQVVQTQQHLSEESIVIHQLTHDKVAEGAPLKEALTLLLKKLAGKILIAHHAIIEYSFISKACKSEFGGDFLIPIIDTQIIAKKVLERKQSVFSGSELRLFNLRERYNLPRYQAHNALSDALAAGELFCAQMAERNEKTLPVKDLLYRL
jgi:DNA polymerase-3 subunit epsilon